MLRLFSRFLLLSTHGLTLLFKTASWNVPSMSEFSELLPDAKSPMVQQIRQNRREISQIKELHAKILAKMAGWDWFSNELQLEPYQPHWKPQDLPPLNLTPRTSGSVMRNITGELLNHSGFDLADELCLDMLTDVGVLYMDKMAKLLKSYMEKYGNSLQPTVGIRSFTCSCFSRNNTNF